MSQFPYFAETSKLLALSTFTMVDLLPFLIGALMISVCQGVLTGVCAVNICCRCLWNVLIWWLRTLKCVFLLVVKGLRCEHLLQVPLERPDMVASYTQVRL